MGKKTKQAAALQDDDVVRDALGVIADEFSLQEPEQEETE